MKNIQPISSEELSPESSNNTDFLNNGSGLPKEDLQSLGNHPLAKEKYLASASVLEDIEKLSPSKLRKKYYRPYKRWDNMKQRKKKGAIIDPRFHCFSDFLRYMGDIPNKDYTLDRIDNDNPTYSPENCRWADKYTQNSNKGNNVYIDYKGKRYTIAQLAKITNQKVSTLYKRKSNGWSDEEIITGDRDQSINDPWRNTPWPKDNQINWEGAYQQSIVRGEDMSRLEFLLNLSEQKLKEVTNIIKEIVMNSDPYDDDFFPPQELVDKEEKWFVIHENAKAQLDFINHRKLFVNRKNSLGKYQEAILFDLLNQPQTIEDGELS
jgi:hypothetical protein